MSVTTRTGVSDCVSAGPRSRVCVCVSTRIGENPEGQVSVWFHVGVETKGLRLQPGSSVPLRRASEVKV